MGNVFNAKGQRGKAVFKVGFFFLSLKMTNIIAQRESLGKIELNSRSLKASNNDRRFVRRLQRRNRLSVSPSDSRWAIMLVAVGDFE